MLHTRRETCPRRDSIRVVLCATDRCNGKIGSCQFIDESDVAPRMMEMHPAPPMQPDADADKPAPEQMQPDAVGV